VIKCRSKILQFYFTPIASQWTAFPPQSARAHVTNCIKIRKNLCHLAPRPIYRRVHQHAHLPCSLQRMAPMLIAVLLLFLCLLFAKRAFFSVWAGVGAKKGSQWFILEEICLHQQLIVSRKSGSSLFEPEAKNKIVLVIN